MAVNAMLGTAVSTSSTIMGRTGLSAVMGQTLSGGGTFNPQTQGTLVNWYDASTLGLANLADVNPWPDSKTGNPNPMTPAAGSPTYATNQQNSLSTVWFNGAQAYQNGGSTASTFPYTIAAVINVTTVIAGHTILGPTANGGVQLRVDATTGTLTLNKSNVAGIGTSTGTVSTAAYHVIFVTVTSSAYDFYIDSTTSAGSGSHSQSLTGGTTFQMGVNVAGGETWLGYIGELQIYNSAFNSTDRNACIAYLKAKWGL